MENRSRNIYDEYILGHRQWKLQVNSTKKKRGIWIIPCTQYAKNLEFHFGVVDTPVNCSVSITIYVDIVIWRNHNLINHCRGLCRLNSRGHGYVISLGFFLFTDEDCTITISRKGKVMPLKRFVESSQFHSLFSKQFIQVGLWSFWKKKIVQIISNLR